MGVIVYIYTYIYIYIYIKEEINFNLQIWSFILLQDIHPKNNKVPVGPRLIKKKQMF